MTSNYPLSRSENLVIQGLKDELLIYDLKINKALCLNQTSALVWNVCDGTRSVFEIKETVSRHLKAPVKEEVIWLTLEILSEQNLLASEINTRHLYQGMSRREVVRKIGIASTVSLPVISSIVAPAAAQSQSICFGLSVACTSNSQCCSNTCRTDADLSTNVPPRCCVSTTNEAFEPGIGFCSSRFTPRTCAEAGTGGCCSGIAIPVGPVPPCDGFGETCQCAPYP